MITKVILISSSLISGNYVSAETNLQTFLQTILFANIKTVITNGGNSYVVVYQS